jgi:hypothetical protein
MWGEFFSPASRPTAGRGRPGGGIWLSYLDRAYTLSLALASGEERTSLYAQAGFGF